MKNKKILLLIVFSFLMVLGLNFINPVLAAGGDTTAEPVTLINPLGGTASKPEGTVTTPQVLIGKVINSALGIVGSLALLMFIYGGFMWMTAAGSPEKVEKGKQTLMWATLGLIVIFASYAMVDFVISAIAG